MPIPPDAGWPQAAAGGHAPAGGHARIESPAARPGQAALPEQVRPEAPERRLVSESFAVLAADPQQSMEYLYARLFADAPELRSLYPLAMTHTRTAVFEALARMIAGLEDATGTERMLDLLARDHRKFGVREKHLEPFFDAVVQTAEYRSGSDWTPEKAAAWRSVTGYCARVMAAAARRDEAREPAWWIGEVVQHDQRADTIAVLSIRPDKPLNYLPGQYISVQTPRWPRIWRSYSIANAPRGNGLLDIHVRAVPGGLVSTALVHHCGVGDTVALGAARGDLRVSADSGRDLVCVAGGTGLAPVKAITEAVVGGCVQGRRREVTIYLGVRRSGDLYDMRDLETLQLAYPSLTLIPVVEREPDYQGRVGRLPEVVALHPSFRDCDVYLSGPAGLVSATARALSSRVPADRLHHDPLDALWRASRPPKVDHLSR